MFVLLLILWIVFNGKITLEILIIGALISGGICAFCYKFLGYSIKAEMKLIKKIPFCLQFVWVLLREIVLANITVLKILITGKKFTPILYSFTADLKTNEARVALSHSITLTPGTITVELVDNIYVVHCLDESMAEGMKDSDFIKVLKKIES